jgi:two-component system KDP operon response regulator KdpE
MTRAAHQLLIVEDDPAIRDVLRVLLEREGYRLIDVATAVRAEIEARGHKPDLLIVDLGLPDGDGLDVIRRVRAWSAIPILVLSARTMVDEKIAALDAGADDYITKPFSAAELLARVRAGLRRRSQGGQQAPILRLGLLQVDLARRQIRGPLGEVHLTPLEYRVLECLAQQAGMVVRQRQLLREVWGPDRETDARGLRVCITNLRTKLEPDPRRPRYLMTVTGLGYRLCPDDATPEAGRVDEREGKATAG